MFLNLGPCVQERFRSFRKIHSSDSFPAQQYKSFFDIQQFVKTTDGKLQTTISATMKFFFAASAILGALAAASGADAASFNRIATVSHSPSRGLLRLVPFDMVDLCSVFHLHM